MGKFEKLVVLTVLFAAAIVLAIAFNRGDKVEAANPLSGAEKLLGEEPGLGAKEATKLPLPEEPQAKEEEPAGSLLLNAGDESASTPEEPPAAALAAEPVSDRSLRILGDTTGLRPSFLDDYMVYTVAEGETWSLLAQRFYQDGRFTRNLHQANEGMASLAPGTEILVPVYDFIQPEAGLQPGTGLSGAPTTAEPLASETSAPTFLTPALDPSEAAPLAPAATGLLEYVVASGDTLSGIALAALGSAQKWPELLELNKDKLPKPEALKVGMKLKLPAGARLPSASAKPVAKNTPKPEPKPSAKKESSEPTPKKKAKKVL